MKNRGLLLLLLFSFLNQHQIVSGINIRGHLRVPENFKIFWKKVIDPIVPIMLQMKIKGPSTLSSCDGSTTGAFNTQCWFDRFNWITSQNGMTDLTKLSTYVATSSTFYNQSTAMLGSIISPQIDPNLPNSIALSIGDLDSATNPALSSVTANVQTAINSANALSTSLSQTFNTTIANLWSAVSSVLAASDVYKRQQCN